MTKFPPRVLMRFEEWFEAHFLRSRPAHVELEDDSDEELNCPEALLEALNRAEAGRKRFDFLGSAG